MTRAASIALAILLAVPARAHADEVAERPWAQGVSADNQTNALAVFTRGNDAFAQADYTTAVALYREALTLWAHPAIRGNLAVALVHLDQPVEAYLQLEQAFTYGAAPFEPTIYAQLQTNYKLLKNQISRLAITGDISNATVLLDGGPLSAGRHVVRAGSHELVARRTGYLTFAKSIVTAPDTDHTIEVKLVPLADAARVTRRWATWKPWAVVAAGGAVLAAGIGLELAAKGNVDDYELELARVCPSGCLPADIPSSVTAYKDRAHWQTRVGLTSIIFGGATFAAGVTLVVLNQPRRIAVDESGRALSIAPVAAPDSFGVAARGTF